MHPDTKILDYLLSLFSANKCSIELPAKFVGTTPGTIKAALLYHVMPPGSTDLVWRDLKVGETFPGHYRYRQRGSQSWVEVSDGALKNTMLSSRRASHMQYQIPVQ